MEKNHLDYSHIIPSDYYNLVDEDNGQPLDAQKPVLRKNVTAKSVMWTTRWIHRIKGDGVRSRYVARQFKNATEESECDVYAATP
eukprot:5820480-Amphidinium_carterae.3